jgi:hypothetical protein
MLNRIVAAVGITSALVWMTILPAQAATTQSSSAANGFQISPVLSELTIKKGQSQVVDITVNNPTSDTSTDKVVVDDFIASSNENGTPQLLLNGKVADPSHNFIPLVAPIPNITIPPKGTANVTVTISVPSDANSGGYYGVVRLVPVSMSSDSGNVGLTASVGTIFLITVPGNLVEKLDLVQLSAAKNNQPSSLIFSGAPQVLVRLNNVGDIHVQPFGVVNVKSMSGKVVASYEFNNVTPRGNILPGSIRKFVNTLPKRTWLGHYTIEASLAYASGSGNLIIATAGFWYIPVWFVVTFVIVVILIVAAIYWLVLRCKTRSRSHQRR